MDCARAVNLKMLSQRIFNTVQNESKLIDLVNFSDKNRVYSSNFNATILKFSEKFYHQFSHFLIFVNIFPES